MKMNKKLIYLDNAASTRMDERVLKAMKPYFFETYAVATSEFAYTLGIEAKEALDNAREIISNKLNGAKAEIIFTSGGTEASNLAIKGIAETQQEKGKHLIVSKIEDFPVLNSAKKLERNGFKVTYLNVDETGLVDLEEFKDALTEETILVSIQHANQEIGTIQDIKKIGKICKEKEIIFHTDATHTFTRVPIDLQEIKADLVTLSGHTIHGPKGIGALFIRKGTQIKKQMDGGFQENNLRGGVENIPGAVGFSKAIELVTDDETKKIEKIRNELIKRLQKEVPNTTLNGHPTKRVPQNANITFHQVEGESITLHLDMKGFAVSTGSACFSKSLEASHVIMGIGGDHERAHGSVRFTIGRFNKMEEVSATVEAVKEVVERLRKISPLTE
jgi:cysteine desulfurase